MHQENVRAYADQIGQIRRENAEALLRSEQNGKRIAEVREQNICSSREILLLTPPYDSPLAHITSH